MMQTFFGTFPLNDYNLYATLTSGPKKPGVKIITTYAITNKRTGRAYVGATKNFFIRWRGHYNGLKRKAHPNDMLQAAYTADPDGFVITIVSHLDTTTNLIEREVEAGAHYDVAALYNYKLGNNWINGHHPLNSSGIKSGGYRPKKTIGKQTKSRWFDGTGMQHA